MRPTDDPKELSPLQRALVALKDLSGRLDAHEAARHEPIAVVGMACRFPGGATDPEAYWRLLTSGADGLVEIPADRWDVDAFHDPDPDRPGKIYTRHGGFLEGPIDRFDADFFGIAHREAASLDPQQRLLLEVAWESLEDAGIRPDLLGNSPTGVWVGMGTSDYGNLQLGDPENIDAYYGSGNAFCVAAGRISYFLGLQGPNAAIDTACSSSLVCVAQAVQHLRDGSCNLALAGGVNLMLSPESMIYLCKVRALSPTGLCKVFDADADGYVRGEGAGVLALKRLTDARRDGDRIHAVIRGTAYNHDGRSSGLTVPNGGAQRKVLQAALDDARLVPADVGYVEAHGTGTSLGDPIEARALDAVYGRGRAADAKLLVGSVKANVGHLEAAAGVAGMIKAILILRHGRIPGQLHLRTPSPHIDWSRMALSVPTRDVDWPATGGAPRRVGVSAFGFSGTNAHVVVEEPPSPEADATPSPAPPRRARCLLTLSARDEEQLADVARATADAVEPVRGAALAALCRAAGRGRARFDRRLALSGDDGADLATRLRAFAETGRAPGVVAGRHDPARDARLAFLFTGQGAQEPGMTRGLYASEPVYRDALDRCAGVLDGLLDRPLLDVLFADDPQTAARVHRTGFTQPALFSVEYALVQLFASWGIRPAVVLGHSVGEYAAACAAGWLDLEQGLRLIAERGRLMEALPEGGRMAAVFADESAVRPVVEPHLERADIAALNGPENTVVSGAGEAIDAILAELAERGIRHQELTVSHAFHSPAMDPMLDAFASFAAGLGFGEPSVELISNVTGRLAEPGQLAQPGYWRRHVRKPVRFADGVRAAVASGVDAFVEIGPHPVLIGMARRALPDADDAAAWIPTLRRKRDDDAQIAGALAALFVAGVDVDWDTFDPPAAGERAELPHYPFRRKRFWFRSGRGFTGAGAGAGTGGGAGEPTAHPLLGSRLRSPALRDAVFETRVAADSPAWLADHAIFDATIFPATGYVELAAAASAACGCDGPATIENFTVDEPLLLDAGPRRLQTVIEPPAADGRRAFAVYSAPIADPGSGVEDGAEPVWSRHAAGELLAGAVEGAGEATEPDEPDDADLPQGPEPAAFYAALAARGVAYGPAFQGVAGLRGAETRALGEIRRPDLLERDAGRYRLHPAVLDASLQVLGATLAGAATDDDTTYLPIGIERIRILRDLPAAHWTSVKVRRPTGADATTATADLTIRDDAGRPVLELERFTAQKASAAALRRGAHAAGARWLHEEVWRPARAPERPSPEGGWLLVGDGALARAVESALREAGARVERRGDDADEATLRAGWEALGDGRRGLLHLVAADGLPTQGTSPSSSAGDDLVALAGRQRARTGSLLHAIRALAAAGAGDDTPRLAIFTRGAQTVGDADGAPDADGATLWGLGRVAASEHPELRPALIDLDPAVPATAAAVLATLDPDDRESQSAWRAGGRLALRLVRRREPRPVPALPGGAFALQIDERGVLDNLRYASVDRRAPGPGEVELRCHATGLNFRDVLNVLGMYPGDPGPLGGECVGRVVAVGTDVDHLAVGDRVLCVAGGTFRTYVTTDAAVVRRIPPQLDFEQAATIPITFLTAHYALHRLAGLQSGETVLIHAAAGGVGMAAVQIALRAGARVIGTAGSEAKRERVRALGVEHVFDSRSVSFAEGVRSVTEGRGVDVVLNALTGEFLVESLRQTADGGRFVEIGKAEILTPERLASIRPEVAYFAFDLGEELLRDAREVGDAFEELMRGFADGALRPLPHRTFPVERTLDAFRFMAQARHVGKIVVSQEHRVAPDEAEWTGASWCVTGGLGGLGLRVAERFAERGVGALLLVGRSEPGAVAREAIERMRAAGVRVETLAADAGTESGVDAIGGALERLAPGMPRAVLHAAGVLDDGVLEQQTWERFATVFRPKVDGGFLLARAARACGIGRLVFFSSTSALLGAAGQGNYAAANAYLDALAVRCRAEGLRAQSIQWGGWAEVGMAAGLEAAARARGVTPIAPAAGLDVLETLLATDVARVAVAPIRWDDALASVPADRRSPLFDELVGTGGGATPGDGTGRGAGAADAGKVEAEDAAAALRRELAAAPRAERPALLRAFVRDQVAKVLGNEEPGALDPEARFADLGLDSLMAVELRNALAAAAGRALPASLVYDYPSIRALTAFLGEQVSGAEIAPPGQGATEPGVEPAVGPAVRRAVRPAVEQEAGGAADLEALSQEEMAELLAERLASLNEEGDG